MASITVFVYNNCKTDARVLKEAKTLADQGFKLKIIALLDKVTRPHEERDGFEIIRVEKNPVHYRFFRFKKYFFDLLIWMIKIYFKVDGLLTARKSKETYNQFKEKGELDGKANAIKWALTMNIPLLLLIGLLMSPLLPFLFVLGLLTALVFYGPLKALLMVFHRPLCFIDYYQKALAIAEKDKTDFYHGHDLHTLPVAYLCKKRFGGKAVYDSHELYTEISTLTNLERSVYKYLETKLAPKVDGVITVNESIAVELSERYGISKPVVVMNCPVVKGRVAELSENILKKRVGLDDDKKLILYQGGFAPNRGLENLIKSARYIDEGVIVYMGWGRIESDLKKLVEQEGLNEKVLFTGPVAQEDLLNYSQCADVGMIPYQFVGLNNYYTSPNKLFEYVNAHIPIAGSNFPELVKVIDGFEIGKTFDPELPEDIAAAINHILASETKRQEMIQNTYKAAEIYTWENESKKLVDLYAKLSA